MKSIEEKLKEYMLTKYKSIREFAINIDMPYSTIDSIFKRGIANASVTNINKICKSLNISADMLAEGEIQPATNKKTLDIPESDIEIIQKFLQLNERNKIKIEGKIDDYLEEQKKKSIEEVPKKKDVQVPPETIRVTRAAKSETNKPPEVVDMPISEIEELRNAPKVTSMDDI